jgi:hypothetical protein
LLFVLLYFVRSDRACSVDTRRHAQTYFLRHTPRTQAQGFTLNEHSLKEIGGAKKVIPALTEEDLFEALGLDYVAPIHREYGK